MSTWNWKTDGENLDDRCTNVIEQLKLIYKIKDSDIVFATRDKTTDSLEIRWNKEDTDTAASLRASLAALESFCSKLAGSEIP